MSDRSTLICLTAAIAFLATAAGCAQQPARSVVGAPVAAAPMPTQAALRVVSPQLLRAARDRGYEPKYLFCRGSRSDWSCRFDSKPGYRRVLYFCMEETTGSHLSGADCVDATHLYMKLRELDATPFPADATIN